MKHLTHSELMKYPSYYYLFNQWKWWSELHALTFNGDLYEFDPKGKITQAVCFKAKWASFELLIQMKEWIQND